MISVVLLLAASSLLAQPVEYKIESGGENKLSLEVEKTGFMKGKRHVFTFPRFQGKLSYDAQSPANSKVELKIETASLTCQDAWVSPKDLSRILQEAQTTMLMSKQYPEMRFVSTKVTSKGGNRFQVEGALTIRGVGKPITIDAVFDPDKKVIDGTSLFRMTSYGMKPPTAALGAIGTKDEMTASFHVAAR